MEGPVLRDIHLPPAPWWPPAPGWWLLALLLLAVAACIGWWLRRRARRAPLRAALREIDAIEAAYAQDGDAARLTDGASRLLRRVARRIDPNAASRSGTAWREFLHRHARGASVRQALDDLVEARFRAHPMPDAPALLAALRAWCRNALRVPGASRTDGLSAQPASSRRSAAVLRAWPFGLPFVAKGGAARTRRADRQAAS